MSWIPEAVRQVELDNPPKLTIDRYPMSFAVLSEGYQRRDAEQEAAPKPAA